MRIQWRRPISRIVICKDHDEVTVAEFIIVSGTVSPRLTNGTENCVTKVDGVINVFDGIKHRRDVDLRGNRSSSSLCTKYKVPFFLNVEEERIESDVSTTRSKRRDIVVTTNKILVGSSGSDACKTRTKVLDKLRSSGRPKLAMHNME